MPRVAALPLRIVLVVLLACLSNPGFAEDSAVPKSIALETWSGNRAMADIAAQLQLTPRSIGTQGHEQTIQFIKDELAKTSAKHIKIQRWIYNPRGGGPIILTNIVASLNPSAERRILVGTHYDSIVRAYADLDNPNGPMPGANNSASGVALLLETARALSALPELQIGVDFVFFDGEEGPKALGAGDPDWKALGSPYFAQHISEIYPAITPEKGVIFDMVCYKNLKLNPEEISLKYAHSEVAKFWAIGRSVAPDVFLPETSGYPVNDDQTALIQIGIPSILVIDFKYDPWFNTTKDTADKCSAASLEAVGRTLVKYLYAQ